MMVALAVASWMPQMSGSMTKVLIALALAHHSHTGDLSDTDLVQGSKRLPETKTGLSLDQILAALEGLSDVGLVLKHGCAYRLNAPLLFDLEYKEAGELGATTGSNNQEWPDLGGQSPLQSPARSRPQPHSSPSGQSCSPDQSFSTSHQNTIATARRKSLLMRRLSHLQTPRYHLHNFITSSESSLTSPHKSN
jgi:hypothetical protein